jgi:ceramide glucosyltransferase
VAYFVNSHGLLTYIPYAALTEPVTINGMFYAIRRDAFDSIGGFDGLEHILADDFAIAQRMRAHGHGLAQTSLRHGISTSVASARQYFNLIQRWFIFPRESIMRHINTREKLIFYGVIVLPIFFPWLAVLVSALSPAWWPLTVFYFLYSYLIFAHLNRAYLGSASPWIHSYWVTLLSILLPMQLLAALLAPQRIIWRGHVMQAEAGGKFKFVRRRSS